MKRRTFLQLLGLSAVPMQVMASMPEKDEHVTKPARQIISEFENEQLANILRDMPILDREFITGDKWTTEEIARMVANGEEIRGMKVV